MDTRWMRHVTVRAREVLCTRAVPLTFEAHPELLVECPGPIQCLNIATPTMKASSKQPSRQRVSERIEPRVADPVIARNKNITRCRCTARMTRVRDRVRSTVFACVLFVFCLLVWISVLRWFYRPDERSLRPSDQSVPSFARPLLQRQLNAWASPEAREREFNECARPIPSGT